MKARARRDRGYYDDPPSNLNRRTNNGASTNFIVDTKNQLTNAPSPYGTQLYDADGDLRTNHSGNWEYEYDYENQLTLLYRYDTSIHQNHKATEWQYDVLHRLRNRIEYHWQQQQTELPLGVDEPDTP